MLRTQVAMIAALAAILCAMNAGQAQGLKLGAKFEGELKGKSKPSINLRVADGKGGSKDKVKGGLGDFGGGTLQGVWTQELPIALKAGQSVSISVSVVGQGRKVALVLVNPTGKVIKTANITGQFRLELEDEKTAQLEFEEVGAAGKYSIVVISDEPGPFTLRTTGPATKDLDEKALKQKIEELEEELADLKKKLKALDKKK